MERAILAVSLSLFMMTVSGRPVAMNDLEREFSRGDVPALMSANPSINVVGDATNHRGCYTNNCIFIQNDCKEEILVAAHYIPLDESEWKTEGWWPVKSRQLLLILGTQHSTAYLHAHFKNDPSIVFGPYICHWKWDILGKPYDFFEFNMEENSRNEHTQRFAC